MGNYPKEENMGIFKKKSKVTTTAISTKKPEDDVYNAACLKVATLVLTNNP